MTTAGVVKHVILTGCAVLGLSAAMASTAHSFLGGCANGAELTHVPATGWRRVRIIDPNGSPEIVLDNIFINGKFTTRP